MTSTHDRHPISAPVRAVFLVAGLILLWHLREILLLLFGGILVGVVIKQLKHRLQDLTHWPHLVCLLAVLFGLIAILAGMGFLIAPPLISQSRELIESAPTIWKRVQEQLSAATWLQTWWEQNHDQVSDSVSKSTPKGFSWVVGALGNMLSSSIGFVTGIVVVLGIGFYLAVEPRLYISGMVRLVPQRWDSRVRDALTRSGNAISGWMLGQLGSVTVVAVCVTVGLWMLGVPHSLALGVLAGVLAFIPNLGPIAAFIPAVIVAFAERPMLAVWTAVLYVSIQLVENNFLTPMLQRRIIAMPPALMLAFQVISAALAGLAGILVAAPLLAVIMTLIQCLYVEGVLGKESPNDCE